MLAGLKSQRKVMKWPWIWREVRIGEVCVGTVAWTSVAAMVVRVA